MTNKLEVLETILDRLKTEHDTVDEFLDRDAECLAEIIKLSDDFGDVIFDYAKSLLGNIQQEETNEYCFQVLLRALVDRNQQHAAFVLASEALLSDNTEDKLFYVTLLVDLNLPETSGILIKGLDIIESFDEMGGHAQEKAIEFLMLKSSEEAYPAIVKCLSDVSARVRATALQFMKKFDKEESSFHLIKMLEEEDWEFNILLILELLRKWKKKEFLPQLMEYSKEEWVEDNPDIKQAFETIIKEFGE
jgi:HEAT repeat protein